MCRFLKMGFDDLGELTLAGFTLDFVIIIVVG